MYILSLEIVERGGGGKNIWRGRKKKEVQFRTFVFPVSLSELRGGHMVTRGRKEKERGLGGKEGGGEGEKCLDKSFVRFPSFLLLLSSSESRCQFGKNGGRKKKKAFSGGREGKKGKKKGE